MSIMIRIFSVFLLMELRFWAVDCKGVSACSLESCLARKLICLTDLVAKSRTVPELCLALKLT